MAARKNSPDPKDVELESLRKELEIQRLKAQLAAAQGSTKPTAATDPRDQEIARLKAEIEAAKQAQQTQAAQAQLPDPRDAEIERLKQQLAATTSDPKDQEIQRLKDELAKKQAAQTPPAEKAKEEAKHTTKEAKQTGSSIKRALDWLDAQFGLGSKKEGGH